MSGEGGGSSSSRLRRNPGGSRQKEPPAGDPGPECRGERSRCRGLPQPSVTCGGGGGGQPLTASPSPCFLEGLGAGFDVETRHESPRWGSRLLGPSNPGREGWLGSERWETGAFSHSGCGRTPPRSLTV